MRIVRRMPMVAAPRAKLMTNPLKPKISNKDRLIYRLTAERAVGAKKKNNTGR